MKIKIEKKIKTSKGILIAPLTEEDLKTPPVNFPKEVKDFIKLLVKEKEFEAKKNQSALTYINSKNLPGKLALVGLGPKAKLNAKVAREVGGKIGKIAKGNKKDELSFLLNPELENSLAEVLEGAFSATYEIDKLKNKKPDKERYRIQKFHVITESKSKSLDQAVTKAEIVMEASEFVKDLVNLPANIVDVDYMAKEAKRIAKENRYKVAIIEHKQLQKMGWGGLLAVNSGSEKGAKCLVLEYSGAANKREKPIVLVGKGVIFDTGGYNLKPTRSIETMHQDMAGGATVLGVMSVLKKLGIKKNVIGIVPTTDNLINDKAYRPSDIITMYSGHTVEITNTDAEGRLILADAITYGTKFDPQYMITIATLTGAAAVALGDLYAALVYNDEDLMQKVKLAGDEVDEWGWPLPLPDEYRKKMESKIADLTNYDLGSGRYAGTAKAGAFLEKFVEKNKWCHIDIGGTAFTDDPKEYQTMGATAHGLQMLIRFLENEAAV